MAAAAESIPSSSAVSAQRGAGLGRAYFALQTALGAVWWWAVFASDAVREATLGGLDPVLVAVLDIPLFVAASALAAAGARWACWIVVPWTLIVTALLGVYATLTGLAGWGVLCMGAASVGGVAAWLLIAYGRIPAERLLVGPLAFRASAPGSPRRQFVRTILQMLAFWAVFLAVIPMIIVFFERRWGLAAPLDPAPALWIGVAGWVLLAAMSAMGLWAAIAMSTRGDGTPLPSAHARRLVVAGPYRFVRNPMALSGVAQAVGVGLILGSWLVVLYALVGAFYWDRLVRPAEEADLEARFDSEYAEYRRRIRCWVPRLS